MNESKVVLIVPDILNSFSGIETHGEYFYSFLKKHSILDCVLTRKNNLEIDSELDDGIIIKKDIEVYSNKSLTGNLKDDTKILNSINKDKKIFFLNNLSWLPIFEDFDKKKSKIIVRSGGNDLIAGWISYKEIDSNNIKKNQKKLIELINQKIDLLIVNSSYSYAKYIELGVKQEKLVKIMGGIDKDFLYKCSNIEKKIIKQELNIPKNKKVILSVGRLIKFKGFEHSLEVVKKLKEKRNDFIYIIIGTGPDYEKLKNKVKKLDIEDLVRFEGYFHFQKISKYLRVSDLLLHSPIYAEIQSEKGNYIQTETMGRVIYEALSAGCPVIGSNVGGIPEIIDDKFNGFITKEKDINKTLYYIEKCISNKNLLDFLSKNAYEISDKITWEVIFRKYIDLALYLELI
ncbi:MAG: glycosyltransferase family 4 protein [Candidatus Woesearchaeota archaeon]